MAKKARPKNYTKPLKPSKGLGELEKVAKLSIKIDELKIEHEKVWKEFLKKKKAGGSITGYSQKLKKLSDEIISRMDTFSKIQKVRNQRGKPKAKRKGFKGGKVTPKGIVVSLPKVKKRKKNK